MSALHIALISIFLITIITFLIFDYFRKKDHIIRKKDHIKKKMSLQKFFQFFIKNFYTLTRRSKIIKIKQTT